MSDVWTPPRAEVKDLGVSGNPDAPEIRRAHMNHEANIKALGSLYYLGSGGMLVGAVVTVLNSGATAYSAGAAAALLLFCALYFWLARGLRQLKSGIKIPAGVVSGIGLVLGFPFGTVINAYVLYLLFSKKGSMVFSDEYKQIIADTPDMKYRTSIIVWIFLALLVGVILFAIIGARSH